MHCIIDNSSNLVLFALVVTPMMEQHKIILGSVGHAHRENIDTIAGGHLGCEHGSGTHRRIRRDFFDYAASRLHIKIGLAVMTGIKHAKVISANEGPRCIGRIEQRAEGQQHGHHTTAPGVCVDFGTAPSRRPQPTQQPLPHYNAT